MGYACLEDCLLDLEKRGELVRISEPVDPHLEMAAIHLRVHQAQGPALLFENVIGSQYRAASNIYGTLARSEYLFRDTLAAVQQLIQLKGDPIKALKQPHKYLASLWAATKALPRKKNNGGAVGYSQISIDELPQIKHWPMDGGAFVTLPQVYTEHPAKPGIMNSNLGMYRVQLSGNDYLPNQEIGLHYQLHRGIGVHQSAANQLQQALKVSCFIGGPPSHAVSAVMPLPEGMTELAFAGLLGARRFRYSYHDGYCVSNDADFVITGSVAPHTVKPEGPFGDHLGYYSLQHNFPVMKVHKVYARKNAIWPFTVVGRPPQEDTSFGQLIHAITGNAIQQELPGMKEVHAVDAAGVHPLLFAIGSERYTPYSPTAQPSELLTIANRALGTGQLSLAKYLWITASDDGNVSTHHEAAFLQYMLERVVWSRDLHFYTNTSIDTLDYSGTSLNSGSKVVIAAYGMQQRTLACTIPPALERCSGIASAKICMPGIIAISTTTKFESASATTTMIDKWSNALSNHLNELDGTPLFVLCDDAEFLAANTRNFLWVTFTRSNPSHDIHGIASFIEHKHWGCRGPLVVDARSKPHHAPVLELDTAIEKKVDSLFAKGGVLEKWGVL